MDSQFRFVILISVIAVAASAVFMAVALQELSDGVHVSIDTNNPLSLAGSIDTGSQAPGQSNCARYRIVALRDSDLKAAASDDFSVFLAVLEGGSRALVCSTRGS